MKHEDLERILAGDEEIVPASGFTASVMDLVRREAAALPPIPFPWRRLAAGIAASILASAWLAWSGLTAPLWDRIASMPPEAWSALAVRAADAAARTGAAWTLGALLLALVSWTLALRLATPRT